MDTTFNRAYFDWFPSAYMQYKINDSHLLNLSYSRKIIRPGYGQLNPFRTYLDPFTYESGNPDLNPAYSNSVILAYNKFLNFTYSLTNGIFDQVFTQDPEAHVTGIVRKNIGKKQGLNVSAYLPLDVTHWYNIGISGETGWNMVASRFNEQKFKKNYWGATVDVDQTFTILPSLKISTQITWNKGGWQGTTKYDNFWQMDAQMVYRRIIDCLHDIIYTKF